ncbi:MAG: hypothetical protein ABL916_14905 [Burkholderiaceae bacterium]
MKRRTCLFAAQADKPQRIFATLDPERDSPVVLRACTPPLPPAS